MLNNIITLIEFINNVLTETNTNSDEYQQLLMIRDDIQSLITVVGRMTPQFNDQMSFDEKLALRQQFDKDRIAFTISQIEAIRSKIATNPFLKNFIIGKSLLSSGILLDQMLNEIKITINNAKDNAQYSLYQPDDETYLAAKMFASEIVPICQGLDPFIGAGFSGYCWGHTHHWGKSIEHNNGIPDLRMISTEYSIKTWSRNWTFEDILMNRIGWYRPDNNNYAKLLWNVLDQLTENDLFNFNFYIPGLGFHSTGIRMYGKKGIEFIDSNNAIFRFESKHDFVGFMMLHLYKHAAQAVPHSRATFITVYRLPYQNKQPSNIPATTITPQERFAAIQYYEQHKQIWRNDEEKKYLRNIFNFKLQELNRSDAQLGLLQDLRKKIVDEMNRLVTVANKEAQLSPDDTVKSRSLTKIEKIQNDLDIYYPFVKNLPNCTEHQKTCLLFALMSDSLSEKREFSFVSTATSYKNVHLWVEENLLDRELIKKYQKNIQIYKSQAIDHVQYEGDVREKINFVEQRLKQQGNTKTFADAAGIIGQYKGQQLSANQALFQLQDLFWRSSNRFGLFSMRSKANQKRYLELQNVDIFRADLAKFDEMREEIIQKQWIVGDNWYSGKKITVDGKQLLVPHHIYDILQIIERVKNDELSHRQALRDIWVIVSKADEESEEATNRDVSTKIFDKKWSERLEQWFEDHPSKSFRHKP